jgi:anti-anti-sigma factor
MEAKIRHLGEIAIISLKGPLEIEYTQPLRDTCAKHFVGKKIIFNMEKANFVGSTGIQSFVDTVKMLNEQSQSGLKLVGLKSEFRRIFQNLEMNNLEIHDTEVTAIQSFDKPQVSLMSSVRTIETQVGVSTVPEGD